MLIKKKVSDQYKLLVNRLQYNFKKILYVEIAGGSLYIHFLFITDFMR